MSRVACGWYDTVSTLLQDMYSQGQLAALPGALSLAAHIKGRYSFSHYTVYVNVTQGQLTPGELVSLTGHVRDHSILGQHLEEVYATSDGKGLLFVSNRSHPSGTMFMRQVAQAFADMRFVTDFTADGGHGDFARMR